ncbi:MAG: hypothetical protein ACRD98_00565 [Nitrososphaera sp.]
MAKFLPLEELPRVKFRPLETPTEYAPPSILQAAKTTGSEILKKIRGLNVVSDPTQFDPLASMLGREGMEGLASGIRESFGGIPQAVGVSVEPGKEPTSTRGKLGYALGAYVPWFLAPGATTIPKMVAQGAAMGLGQLRPQAEREGVATAATLPVEAAEAALKSGLVSGGIGGALSVIPKGAGLLLDKMRRGLPLSKAESKLAQLATEKYGIPLTPAMRSSGEFQKRVEATMQKIPGSAKIARKNIEDANIAFTRAVNREIGEDAPALNAEVRAAFRRRSGKEFDAIAEQVNIGIDTPAADTLISGIAQATARYSDVIPSMQKATIGNYIDDLVNKLAEGRITGETYQKTRSNLRRIRDATRKTDWQYSNAANDVLNAMDDAAAVALPADQARRWERARKQYATFKVVSPIAQKTPSGILSGSQVHQRVIQKYGEAARVGNLGELAEIGKTFLVQPSTSGTAENILAQRAITGGLVGGGFGAGAVSDPQTTALTGAGLWAIPKAVSHAWFQTPAWQRASRLGQLARSGTTKAGTLAFMMGQ